MPIGFEGHRDYVRDVLIRTAHLRANGTAIVEPAQESPLSIEYRTQLNSGGSPSEIVAAGWQWTPGGSIAPVATNGHDKQTMEAAR